MTEKFYVEDKLYTVPENYYNQSNFIVQSSPRPYDVEISCKDNILQEIQKKLDENNKNLLLVDKKVYDLYFKDLKVKQSRVFLANAEEEFKTIDGILQVIDFLEKNEFTKTEKLIVVGGGIIEDVGAFVGAAFKRGINWIFYPTTLLSMCDSCIGGKTGINHNNTKNQLALFSAPRQVVINTNFLKTLSQYDIKSGMGEILKLLVTGGKDFVNLYQNLVNNGKINNEEDYTKLITASLMVKKAIVEHDEFEFCHRKSLNYGHTIGHAIEALSEYKIPHGQAVIIGMVIVNKIAMEKGLLNSEDYKLTQALSKELLGKSIINEINLNGIDKLLKRDKKTEGNLINFVIITELGVTKFIKVELNSELVKLIEKIIKEEF